MKKKSVNLPPNFNDFLKEKYDGGEQLVTNTYVETKDMFDKVTVSTLIQNDPNYRRKLFKEYLFWKDKKEPKKEEPPKKKFPALKNKKMQDSFVKEMEEDSKLATYRNRFNKILKEDGLTDALSEVGTYYGSHFYNKLDVSEKEVFIDFIKDWQTNSDTPEAWALHNYLFSKGFEGSRHSQTLDPEDVKRQPTQDHIEVFEKCYNWQQACFEFLGVKELTLYRGATNAGKIPSGSKVRIESRVSASFTLKKHIASDFGTVFEYTISPEQVFMSPFVSKRLGEENQNQNQQNEEEYIVIEPSNLEGTKLKPF